MKQLLTIALLTSLYGCSNTVYDLSGEEPEREKGFFIEGAKRFQTSQSISNNVYYKPDYRQGRKIEVLTNERNINKYVQRLMQDLLSNLQYVNKTTPIMVASFVKLDSNFQSADLLGQQIAESFMHEVHKIGIPVLDHKLMDFVRITPNGDIALSKDYLDLETESPFRYVLTGTLLENSQGTLVNARIIGLSSKAIVASAQGFIPKSVTEELVTSTNSDGIFFDN